MESVYGDWLDKGEIGVPPLPTGLAFLKEDLHMKLTSATVIIIGALAMTGCNPDGTDLNKAVEFYYAPGKRSPSGKDTYHLLSTKSRAQVTKEQWVARRNKDNSKGPKNEEPWQTRSVEILRQEERQGVTYALVSVTRTNKTYQDNWTHTWAQEEGKWRILVFPKTAEEADRAFSNGDYPTARAKAEEWLGLDPFCVDAYSQLAASLARGHVRASSDTRSLDDVVRAVLAINPKDSEANSLAVSWTKDPQIARTFLKRLEGTQQYKNAAFNLALAIDSLPERLNFLKEAGSSPSLSLVKLETLAGLGRWEECRVQLKQPNFEKEAREDLESQDPSYAAVHGSTIGVVSLAVGDTASAQRWLDLAVSRDPNNAKVKSLAGILRMPDPGEVARRLLAPGLSR